MQYFIAVMSKYFVFEGRASRSEFWWFSLIYTLIYLALMLAEYVLDLGGMISLLFTLAVLLPSFGVSARRLHDTNRSGWWQLLVLLPLVGWIILIVFCAQPSQEGDNRFGPVPKEA